MENRAHGAWALSGNRGASMKGRQLRIVGGGLAGLALAHGLARRGLRVKIVDRHELPPHRVCGEFLRGIASGVLMHLGIELPGETLAHRQVGWWIGERKILQFELSRPVPAVSRPVLERSLRKTLEKLGVPVTKRHISGSEDGEFPEGVVRATGHRLQMKSRWFGFKIHVRTFPLEDDLEMHVGRGGYVGLTPVGQGVVNISGLFHGPLSGEGSLGLDRMIGFVRQIGLNSLAERLMGLEPVQGAVAAVGGLQFGFVRHPGLAVGDALGVIPPYTGHGMAMALESAALVLDPLQAYAEGRLDWSTCQKWSLHRQRSALGPRMRAACFFHSFLVHPRWHAWLRWCGRRNLIPVNWLLRKVTGEDDQN